jgi:hypothetical protein
MPVRNKQCMQTVRVSPHKQWSADVSVPANHVHWFTKFCNISVYLLFVTHLPEEGHMSGRNM